MVRRVPSFLIAAGWLFAWMLLLPKPGEAQKFDWQTQKGTTIRVMFSKGALGQTIESFLPEFEKQTGIKAEFATLPEIQARQKLTVEFTGGSGGIDAWYTSLHVEKRRFWKSGWYLDVGNFLPQMKG